MENQDEWRQPRTVATRLRRANKVRRQREHEPYALRVKEREANLTSNLPAGRNRESALMGVKSRLRQKDQFQQIKDSVKVRDQAGFPT